MSEKDWQKIEDEWETPEEKEEYEFKPPAQGPGIDMNKLQQMQKKAKKNPKLMQDFIADSQVKPGPTMMFATVNYEGCCEEKKKTEELANKWSAMLHSSGMDASAYVIENDTVLFSTQAGMHAAEIKHFALEQPECVAVEWNQKRTPGPAETAEWKERDAEKKAKKEAAKAEKDAAKKEAEAAEAKANAKKKKRRKQQKKAKAEL